MVVEDESICGMDTGGAAVATGMFLQEAITAAPVPMLGQLDKKHRTLRRKWILTVLEGVTVR